MQQTTLANSQLAFIAKRHAQEQIKNMTAEQIYTYALNSMIEDFQDNSGKYDESLLINELLEEYGEQGTIDRLRSMCFSESVIEELLEA